VKGADLVLGFCHGDQREGTVRCVPSNLAAHLAVEPAVADEGAGDAGEGQEVVSFAFVAPVEAAAGEPGHGVFDRPAMPAQSLGGLDALAGDAVGDAALA
jgi:hypothetical protein